MRCWSWKIFLEITPSAISPYKNLKGDLYYFGVGQYQLNEESIEYQVAYEASMKNIISRNITNSKKLLDDVNNSTIVSTTSTTNGDVEILFGWYFDWLQENMPENNYGECGYVALAVYLGYFDQMFNNYVVPAQYENDIDDPSEPTGTNQDFHDYLIQLDGRDPSDPNGNFGSTALRIKNLTWDYLESNENVDKDDFSINWSFIPLNNTIRNAIDNDTPSIIFFGGHVDEVWPNEYVYHTAIAYGYNDDMFIVNLCLQGDNDYSRYYLSEFTVGSYMKMSYSPSSC
ncbi:MAG: hypothetical protein KAU02_01510 [Tenericutes bacterium]|nr:hypothetical protein [Mycoplasmatota bacterium]